MNTVDEWKWIAYERNTKKLLEREANEESGF